MKEDKIKEETIKEEITKEDSDIMVLHKRQRVKHYPKSFKSKLTKSASREKNLNDGTVDKLIKELEKSNPNIDLIRRLRKHIQPLVKIELNKKELSDLVNKALDMENLEDQILL
jgi:hypothetical protein